ncbi:conserved hypothetical protein [Culex quinquefasciatus]|uniref:Uncharacterized protein n=1 Tax=Culex quinquefasciatus TaxID=7176 RepID=B0WQI0_CULQU|nr:conserved hypothetical protein [Culex quinquefasciatus]|eukprot:XP_001850964.1 conserved hypothetical protein [Culex quinquefasciatus]
MVAGWLTGNPSLLGEIIFHSVAGGDATIYYDRVPHWSDAPQGHTPGEAASQILNKAEPLFITRSEAFKFAVGDTITLPCEVSSPAIE